jgi:hypothetical protein
MGVLCRPRMKSLEEFSAAIVVRLLRFGHWTSSIDCGALDSWLMDSSEEESLSLDKGGNTLSPAAAPMIALNG